MHAPDKIHLGIYVQWWFIDGANNNPSLSASPKAKNSLCKSSKNCRICPRHSSNFSSRCSAYSFSWYVYTSILPLCFPWSRYLDYVSWGLGSKFLRIAIPQRSLTGCSPLSWIIFLSIVWHTLINPALNIEVRQMGTFTCWYLYVTGTQRALLLWIEKSN